MTGDTETRSSLRDRTSWQLELIEVSRAALIANPGARKWSPGMDRAALLESIVGDLRFAIGTGQLRYQPPSNLSASEIDATLKACASAALDECLPSAPQADGNSESQTADNQSTPAARESQATRLTRLALASGAEFFHDGDDGFVTVPIDEHMATYSIQSRPFRLWLAREFFEHEHVAAGGEAIRAALETLRAHAIFQGPAHRTAVRVGDGGGKLFIDLCNEAWQVVEIDAAGWRVIESRNCPIRFRRAPGMLPLPDPERGGSVNDLRPFLNVADDSDFQLLIAWLLAAYRDRGPYPILALHGEQGSAKSTTSRILRALIDPNAAPIRSEPREERDLMIAATKSWLCAFDNLSTLRQWLADGLCRLSTGGGFATRTLYSDADETIFNAMRPVILNGISELSTRGDLLDRSLLIYLPSIADSARQPEANFYRTFHAARPRILGALLDAVAAALANVDHVRDQPVPRMADFYKWIVAAEPALSWEPGEFERAYRENRGSAIGLILEGSAVASALQVIGDFQGTASDLLARLNAETEDKARSGRAWPKSARGLAGALRRIAPALATVGIQVGFERAGRERQRIVSIRTIRSEKPGNFASASSASSAGGKSGAESRVFLPGDADDEPGFASAPSGFASAGPEFASAQDRFASACVRVASAGNATKSVGYGTADDADAKKQPFLDEPAAPDYPCPHGADARFCRHCESEAEFEELE
jgi:hypothetical protein